MEKKEEIRIPWGTGIVGFVAESGEPVNIPDAYKVNIIFIYSKIVRPTGAPVSNVYFDHLFSAVLNSLIINFGKKSFMKYYWES